MKRTSNDNNTGPSGDYRLACWLWWWCLPCFGFLFFDPLGLAQQSQDRRSAAGEAEGVSRNSRQSNIIISMFTVNKRAVWSRMLLFDGGNAGTMNCEIWNTVVVDDAFLTRILLQTDAHRRRELWVMLWSWWVVCWFNQMSLCNFPNLAGKEEKPQICLQKPILVSVSVFLQKLRSSHVTLSRESGSIREHTGT